MAPLRRARSMAATVWPVVTGSSGYTSVWSTWAYAASHRSAARAITTQVGGGSAYSSLVWRAMPMPPAGAASPSRIIRSISYSSRRRRHSSQVDASANSIDRSAAGRGPMASRILSRTAASSL
jgi:hypothetical protein